MQWIDVKDRLPEIGRYVLARYNGGNWIDSSDPENVYTVVVKRKACVVGGNDREPYRYDTFGPGDFFSYQISHWMPLPPPPGAQPPQTAAEILAEAMIIKERRDRESAFESMVKRLYGLIESGHKFDWPYTDAFDDGGAAYQEAKRRIAEKNPAAMTYGELLATYHGTRP